MKNLTKDIKIKRSKDELDTTVSSTAYLRYDSYRNAHLVHLNATLDGFAFNKAYPLRDPGKVQGILDRFRDEFEDAYRAHQEISSILEQEGFSVVVPVEVDDAGKEIK